MGDSCLLLPIPMIILVFLVRSLIAAFFLWLGMKVTKEDGAFLALFIASCGASFVRFVPVLGFFLSPVVLMWLVSKWTTADFWPGAALMVVVAWGFAAFAQVGLMLICAR